MFLTVGGLGYGKMRDNVGWLLKIYHDIIEFSQQIGHAEFDREEVRKLIHAKARLEKRPENIASALGYSRIANYKPAGMSAVLNQIEKRWPGYTPPKKRVNYKRPKDNRSKPVPIKTYPRAGHVFKYKNKPTWREIHCSALAGGCGKIFEYCECYEKEAPGPADQAPGFYHDIRSSSVHRYDRRGMASTWIKTLEVQFTEKLFLDEVRLKLSDAIMPDAKVTQSYYKANKWYGVKIKTRNFTLDQVIEKFKQLPIVTDVRKPDQIQWLYTPKNTTK